MVFYLFASWVSLLTPCRTSIHAYWDLKQSQVIHSYFWRSRLCLEHTTPSPGQWAQTTVQSARQLHNWSAIPTGRWRGAPTTEGQKQQIVPLPSMAACPSPPSTPQQPNSQPVATPLGSPQRSHAPPCCLGRGYISPKPGPTAVPCRAQPSRQHVAMRSGQVVRPDPKYFDWVSGASCVWWWERFREFAASCWCMCVN